MNTILCILKEKGFSEKLEAAYRDLKVRNEIKYSDSLDLDSIYLDSSDHNSLALNGVEVNKKNRCSKIILDKDHAMDTEKLNRLIEKVGANNVVLISTELNDEIVKQFLFTGIHIHYEDSPIYSLINKLEGFVSIESAKKNILENTNKNGQKFIAITSPAGGVGKTTLALNLTDVFSGKGKKVLLVDMSIYSDVAAKLQIKHMNGLNNLVSSILQDSDKGSKEKRIDALKNNIVKYEKKNQNFDILFGLTPINAEKINCDVIDEIIKIIREFDYEIVIFDTCSSVSEMSLALVECMDTVMVVALPDVGNGWKLIKQKELYECVQITEKCRLIVNRYNKKSGFSCKQLERELQYPLLGVIPNDDQLTYFSNCGKLITQNAQKGIITYVNYIAHQLEPIFNLSEIKIKKIN